MPRGPAWVGMIGAAVSAAVVTAPQPACACDCVPITPSEAEAEATVVFIGTATSLEGKQDGSPAPVTYVFTVEDVVKGSAGHTVSVQTNNGSAACGVDFQIGQRYEVYALDADGMPFVTQCGGTRLLPADTKLPAVALSEPTAQVIEEDSPMPVEGVIAALGIIAVLVVAIMLVSRNRRRD